MVNSTGTFEATTSDTNQAKPVATISDPTLLLGRRSQANRPAPMKPQPDHQRNRNEGATHVTWLLVRISATSIAPRTTPAPASPQSARRRDVRAVPPARRRRAQPLE